MQRLIKIFAIAVLTAVLTAAGPAGRGDAPARAGLQSKPLMPVDVEIAVDGTGSMASAIEEVRSEVKRVVTGVTSLLPDTRFAVVVFRDAGNPSGEYVLLQPFTSDFRSVEAAVGKIKSVRNPSPGLAESYNLAFQQSYRDTRLGWRAAARKIVLVVGDAEPNGAGTAGLPGCHDQSRDPEGLSTPQELARMRSAKRTLIMIREPSAKASVSLSCYQSLAERAYVGGAARNAGTDVAATIIELIEGAFAPVTLTNDLRVALRNGRAGYTLTLRNPNDVGLTTRSISLTLPAAFRYLTKTTTGAARSEPARSGRTLVWALSKPVAPKGKVRLHVVVKAARRLGKYQGTAVGRVVTAGGNDLVSRAPAAVLRVKRRIRAITLRLAAAKARGATIGGRVSSRFGRTRRALPVRAGAHGSLVLRSGGARVTLKAMALRLERLGAPTRARVTLRVVAARGLAGCALGTRATALIADSAAIRADGSSSDSVRLVLPRACGSRLRPAASVTTAAS